MLPQDKKAEPIKVRKPTPAVLKALRIAATANSVDPGSLYGATPSPALIRRCIAAGWADTRGYITEAGRSVVREAEGGAS